MTDPLKRDVEATIAQLAEEAARVSKSREELEREYVGHLIAERKSRLQRAGVPVTSEDVDALASGRGVLDTHALEAMRRWLDVVEGRRGNTRARPLRFLVLLGLPSRGKTFAGAWLIAHRGGVYVSAPELRRRAEAGGYRDRWRDREWVEGILNSRIVLLDDLGTERADDVAMECLFNLINTRQVSPALTVITANITKDEFATRYGERITRRIEHQGLFVEVGGDDLRRPA